MHLRLTAPPTIILALLTAVLAMGCRSPKVRVAQHADALRLEWATNMAAQAHLPERILDWPAAVSQLRANNLKLRQSRTDLTNAQEAVRQVFRDLAPTLNLRAGVSKTVVDIPSIDADDVTFSADSLFTIPGVVNMSARLYATRLAKLRAEAAYALAEREQLIELYKLFWVSREVEQQVERLETERQTAQAFEQVDPFTGQLMLTQAELRERSAEQEIQAVQQRASELLGNYSCRWAFSTNQLPDLRYDVHPLRLDDTNRVAQLQIRLAAIELEAARVELAGIKLRYWPELNIFVTSPPIYQRSFGNERFWDAKDVRASADVFWWIDTRGYISRQLRQTKRQRALQRERLRQESLSLMQRLLFAQQLLRETVLKAEELALQLRIMEAVPPAQNYAALHKFATEYQATADQLRQVQRDVADLQALFWFVDEAAWANLSSIESLASNR